MRGEVRWPSTFILTKLTMQAQSSHHVRTSILHRFTYCEWLLLKIRKFENKMAVFQ